MDVSLAGVRDGRAAIKPVARVPGADATPDVARVVGAVGPVSVLTEPPHPAFVAASEPAAEHVDRGGGRIPVPREDPGPARRLGPDDAERDRAGQFAVSGRALRAILDEVTVVGLAPVRFEVRDRAENVVRDPPLGRGPLEDLVGGTGEVAGDPVQDVLVPPRVVGTRCVVDGLQREANRHHRVVLRVPGPWLPGREVDLRRAGGVGGQPGVRANRLQQEIPSGRGRCAAVLVHRSHGKAPVADADRDYASDNNRTPGHPAAWTKIHISRYFRSRGLNSRALPRTSVSGYLIIWYKTIDLTTRYRNMGLDSFSSGFVVNRGAGTNAARICRAIFVDDDALSPGRRRAHSRAYGPASGPARASGPGRTAGRALPRHRGLGAGAARDHRRALAVPGTGTVRRGLGRGR